MFQDKWCIFREYSIMGFASKDVNSMNEVNNMANPKEILKLKNLGLFHADIAADCGCSRNTVTKTPKRDEEQSEIPHSERVAAVSAEREQGSRSTGID